MTLRTIGSLVGAANGARDIQAMAANFFLNFRRHANGVAGAQVTSEPFVVVPVSVGGTADRPRLTFALIWTEKTTWQVTDYLSPDDDNFDESWGADNSSGYHIESKSSQREQRFTIDAAQLLLPNEKQIRLMLKWKADHEAQEAERRRLAEIEGLQKRIATLQTKSAADTSNAATVALPIPGQGGADANA